jgi:lactoylglutathione lyase
MAVRSHHTGLTVEDLDRSVAWYARALGFDVQLAFELPDGVRGAMLRAPAGARIELFEVPGSEPGLSRADPPTAMRTRGFGHVAFEVDDIEAAYGALLRAGATEVWSPRRSPEPGRAMAFVHDPDGNLLELIGWHD